MRSYRNIGIGIIYNRIMNRLQYTKEEYDRLLEDIFNRFPSYQTVGKVAYKPGIESMKNFDKMLGSPHNDFISIHIAGTNGKGSLSNMMAAFLTKAGFKTGLFTSPHLLDFRERIRVNGEMIPREAVFNFIVDHKAYMEENNLSFFEITTAMAFDYFAKSKVDYVVVETGLGGRLDSTNIIEPILSIITNIGIDHCDYLGDTIEMIAEEKAGIIKANVPVVIGEWDSVSSVVFDRVAKENNSPIGYASLEYKDEEVNEYFECSQLKGEYQRANIKTLLAAIERLNSKGLNLNKNFSKDFVSKGLRSKEVNSNDTLSDDTFSNDTFSKEILKASLMEISSLTGFRGRWERLSESPCVICDTGHNAHGLKYVMEQLSAEMSANSYKKLWMLFGVVADKDISSVAPLLPVNAHYLFVNAKGSRALSAERLKNFLTDYGLAGESYSDIPEAIEYFFSVADKEDLLFIGGSTFVVAEAIEWFDSSVLKSV